MSETYGKLVVTRLECPDDSKPMKLHDPKWSDIEAAIRKLNGDDYTLVVLGFGDPPGPHMAIGGGENDRYIVSTTQDNRVFQLLINLQAPDGRYMMVAGGQYGDYPLKNCVTLSDALRAARTYAETGENDRTLSWRQRG